MKNRWRQCYGYSMKEQPATVDAEVKAIMTKLACAGGLDVTISIEPVEDYDSFSLGMIAPTAKNQAALIRTAKMWAVARRENGAWDKPRTFTSEQATNYINDCLTETGEIIQHMLLAQHDKYFRLWLNDEAPDEHEDTVPIPETEPYYSERDNVWRWPDGRVTDHDGKELPVFAAGDHVLFKDDTYDQDGNLRTFDQATVVVRATYNSTDQHWHYFVADDEARDGYLAAELVRITQR